MLVFTNFDNCEEAVVKYSLFIFLVVRMCNLE